MLGRTVMAYVRGLLELRLPGHENLVTTHALGVLVTAHGHEDLEGIPLTPVSGAPISRGILGPSRGSEI